MSANLVCPVCGEAFEDEDYCPRHGVRLTAPAVSVAAEAEQAQAAETAPEQVSEELREADVPEAAEYAAPSPDRESRLQAFMRRMGQGARPAREDAAGSPPSGNGDSSPEAESASSVLPEEVRAKGWQIAGPVLGGAAADIWPVRLATGHGEVVGHFCRYRTGALTMPESYRRLQASTSPYVPKVWAHGVMDLAEARVDFDLCSLPAPATALERWLADSQPSEQRAWALLGPLSRLLERLAALGLAPILLEPAHLLRTDDGELCLDFVGALTSLTEAPETLRYRPEFARSALLPHTWAAPEAVQQTMLSGSASVFSVGQIIALALWGQPCSHAELASGAVAFQSVSDARLARVLMGCLWPKSEGRWSRAALMQAAECEGLEAMPEAPPWASLMPGAASAAITLGGRAFWRLEDWLAFAMTPDVWPEAVRNLEAVLTWAETTAWRGQVKLLRDALAAGRSPEWVLIALNRRGRPEAPLAWRHLDLSDEEAERSLVHLGQQALAGNVAAVSTLRELFQADLRGAFAPVSPLTH